MNIFELIYPRFYFDKSKPIRLFEAFSGVGCQAMALKRITDNYELVGFSEIDVHAIKSYQAIHGEVKNYGDITMMGEIPPCDIFTWSFPCTDLSKAGKQKGLSGGTRSGLVYEVLRLLHNTEIKPKVLIMENVIDLVQVKFVDAFNEIQRELEELGYTNYNDVLNAKDFEIPQNRERVFMVSILKDEENEHYLYDFPIKRPLKIRLKDVLEENVDEKYYLSEQNLKTLTAESTGKYQRAEAFRFNIKKTMESGVVGTLPAGQRAGALDPYWCEPTLKQVAQLDGYESSGRVYDEDGLAPTINTMGGGQREPKISVKTWNNDTKAFKTKENDMPRDRIYTDESIGFTITTNESQMPSIVKIGNYSPSNHNASSIVDKNGIAPTVMENHGTQTAIVEEQPSILQNVAPTITTQSGSTTTSSSILIKEATAKGYAEAHDGDGVYLNRPHQKRGVVLKVDDTDVYSDEFEIIEIDNKAYIRIKGELFRIRKLTPLECWRLMGISDEDFYKAKNAGVSNSQLYRQAGNGICISVFEAILREMIR